MESSDCQVQLLQRHAGVRAAPTDEGCCVLALVQIAHREDDVGAVLGEGGGGLVAEAGVGSGDDGDTTGLVRECLRLSTWPWEGS